MDLQENPWWPIPAPDDPQPCFCSLNKACFAHRDSTWAGEDAQVWADSGSSGAELVTTQSKNVRRVDRTERNLLGGAWPLLLSADWAGLWGVWGVWGVWGEEGGRSSFSLISSIWDRSLLVSFFLSAPLWMKSGRWETTNMCFYLV